MLDCLPVPRASIPIVIILTGILIKRLSFKLLIGNNYEE